MRKPSMQIPLVDLKAQYATLASEVEPAVVEVMQSSAYILGPEVEAFEAAFAEFCGVRHCIGVGSGTDALQLALRAAGIGAGDEVITVANSFIATLNAISLCGATPVLVDCCESDFLIDVEAIAAAITPKTRAIMPVHLYGQCADSAPLLELASKHGLPVIEDAAQAHGATDCSGQMAGSFGAVGCFSFYPGKNLGAYGDGGACVTNSDDLAERLRMLRNWGSRVKYHHDEFAMNSRLDTVQAAVLLCKLKRLPDWNQARLERARRYQDLLADVEGVILPAIPTEKRHSFHLYVIRVANRDAVLAALHEAGVGAGVHYPIPTHLTGAAKDLGYGPGAFPVTERLAGEILSLPLYPELTDAQQDYVVETLRNVMLGGCHDS